MRQQDSIGFSDLEDVHECGNPPQLHASYATEPWDTPWDPQVLAVPIAFNHTGDFTYLLQLGATELGKTFNIAVPSLSPSAPDTSKRSTGSLLVSDTSGLQEISVGLQGSFTAGSMARKVGLPWPLADDLITISEPLVVYTIVPASFVLGVKLDIPLLQVDQQEAMVVVHAGGSVELQVGRRVSSCMLCTGSAFWFLQNLFANKQ